MIYWASVAVITQVPLTIGLYHLLRKNISIKIDVYRVIKYLLISIGVFGITYLLMNKFIIYTENLIYFIPNILIFLVFGISLYIVITYLTDSKIRKLVTSIIQELKTRTS